MNGEFTGFIILNVMLKRGADRAKGKVVPWDFVQCKKACLQRFRPRKKTFASDAAKIEKMHLFSERDIDERVEVAQFDLCSGFFLRFSHGALRSGFAQLHKTGRQGPLVVARLDGASTQ